MLTKYYSAIIAILATGVANASDPNDSVPRSLKEDFDPLVRGLVQAGLNVTQSEVEDAKERASRDDVQGDGLGFGRERSPCGEKYPCRNGCRNCFWLLEAFEYFLGPDADNGNKLVCNPLLQLFCATQSLTLPSKYDVPMENLENLGFYLNGVFPEGHPKNELGDKLLDLSCEYDGWCRRRLHEGEHNSYQEETTHEERMKIINKMEHRGAKADATYFQKNDVISEEACDALVKLMDISFEAHVDSGEDTPIGRASDGFDENEIWANGAESHKKVYAEELVALIGKSEAENIVNFFHDSLGDLTIDTMYITRLGAPEDGELYVGPWHVDDYAAMEVILNDGFDGAKTLHMNEEGVHKDEGRKGSAWAHMGDIVHGAEPISKGAKYVLVLKHHFQRPEKEGVVVLSKETVGALPAII